MLLAINAFFVGSFLLFYKKMEGRKDPKALIQIACFTVVWFFLYFRLVF